MFIFLLETNKMCRVVHATFASSTRRRLRRPRGLHIVLPVLDLDKNTQLLHTVASMQKALAFKRSAMTNATQNLS